MQVKLVCASHSPLIYFPATETPAMAELRDAFRRVREDVVAFDPQLVVMFGCDHYGGHQMVSMPAFCVGVEATALADVGGIPGKLDVPRDIAVACVNALRGDDVDVAISYAMDVDHGFSQTLQEACGALDRFPVLPIFVSCLQPPFVPFKRGRALGSAMARFLRSLDLERVLVIGTGGLSHDPEKLYPAIDDVPPEWFPYHLLGNRQSDVPQQRWMDYETEVHHIAAGMLARNEFPIADLKIDEAWDRRFLDKLEHDDLAEFDRWVPAEVIAGGGFGAMETLSWVTAAQAVDDLTGRRPKTVFHRGMVEVAIGFAIVDTDAAPVIEAGQEAVAA